MAWHGIKTGEKAKIASPATLNDARRSAPLLSQQNGSRVPEIILLLNCNRAKIKL